VPEDICKTYQTDHRTAPEKFEVPISTRINFNALPRAVRVHSPGQHPTDQLLWHTPLAKPSSAFSTEKAGPVNTLHLSTEHASAWKD
jgi:hypothetical protein